MPENILQKYLPKFKELRNDLRNDIIKNKHSEDADLATKVYTTFVELVVKLEMINEEPLTDGTERYHR